MLNGGEVLVSSKPVIKCDIIEAKNALHLHESNIAYLYKPTIITSEKIVDENDNEIDCYKMVFKYPSNLEIPNLQDFTFTEYCFGNKWQLSFDAINKYWTGSNIQGRSNGKIEQENKRIYSKNVYGDLKVTGCWVYCKNDEWNRHFFNEDEIYEEWEGGIMLTLYQKGDSLDKVLLKDGKIYNASHFGLSIVIDSDIVKHDSTTGYHCLPFMCKCTSSVNSETLNNIETVYLDITYNDCLNRLTFQLGKEVKVGLKYSCVDLEPIKGSIEVINARWSSTSKNQTELGQDIVLYLNKDYVNPIEEINWDKYSNRFEYIIKQQYYEVTPNPNAATTLYTDYNIYKFKNYYCR